MAEPVFSPDERVETSPQLPKELVAKLEGKSAQQQTALIIDYYSTREKAVISQAREAIRTNDPTKVPGDKGTTVRMERQETPPNVNPNELDGARTTLIAAAKQQ